jgi:hypothetical protein
MKKEDPLASLNKGKYFAAAADFVAAFLFFIAYLSDGSIFFLIAAIALFLAGIGIFIVFAKFSTRLKNINKTNLK